MTGKKLDELKNATGTLAEMSLLFMRDVLNTGATLDEALNLTGVFMQTLLFGNKTGGAIDE